ncbi:Cof-type HAD-IIB family hydrolase [uncultured Eubacterium sp.]|uniref:Cof-type HAD-IIB family hydrolase n=1 Tax=uncultured Eubacterium sp. TaxID=165185 RepID=UPI0026353A1A|nr:Cof-type HAD-IIB family hydrolase [uncultured Eubacterium sp.]
MEYKMIGLDLDGTLLKDDKSIDTKTKEYLETLSSNSVHIVPITGRPLSGVPDCVRNIKGVDYIISNNGSKTVLNSTNETLFSLAMGNATSKRVIEAVKQTGAIFEVFLNHYGYCEKFVFDHYKEVYKGTVLGDYIFSSRKQVDNLMTLFDDKNAEADEVFIICKDNDDREIIKAQTDKISSIQYCMLADRFLEITKKGTDKGTALELLCNHLKIKPDKVIAFGDGENDLQFLNKAGTAVAMGNATDSVKAQADIITDTNNNQGVLKALKSLIR